MSVSVFDHPVLSGLLGDEEVAACFAFEAELTAMLAFEMVLAQAEAAEDVIPADSAEAIGALCTTFEPDIALLRHAAIRDGVAVPELVRQLRVMLGPPHDSHLHFGATSQDAVDTGLVLRLRDVVAILQARTDAVVEKLDLLSARHGDQPLIGRTRMQRAVPITVGDRLAAWRDPLVRHRGAMDRLHGEALVLLFGGAAGTLDKLGTKGRAVARRLGEGLGLPVPERPWHADRTRIVDIASVFAGLSGSLGKVGQDMVLMAQNEIGEIRLKGGGSSSAMPHKDNPVGAETLVALARFSATQMSGIHTTLVAEQERSGSAWTLEWMLLPGLAVAAGASLRIADTLLAGAEFPTGRG